MGNICSALKLESRGRYAMCLLYYPVKLIDIFYTLFITQIINCWEFPGGPVVRTPHFHCMDSMPGQGTNIPQAAKKKKKLLEGTNLILKGKVMMEELEKKTKRSPNKKGMKCSF